MISVTILTKNSQRTLEKTLQSTLTFKEVVVVDSGSTDKTLEIAHSFSNVQIHANEFIGFGSMHNLASELAAHDWILSLDSDEILTKELVEEIHRLSLDPSCVYSMPRHNYFNGKKMRYCNGWGKDQPVRLFHRKKTHFSSDLVHEKVIQANLQEVKLTSPLIHTPYLDISDFLVKMDFYTSLYAEQNREKKKSSFAKALFHGFSSFIHNFFIKGGILGGKEGYLISTYNAQTAFYKYLKLAERKDKTLF
ncbi:MAG: glycosyltransferase family 2 protein [Chlamydiae bacterium]|nr:glycosyltransferase family 2 protein [Chlamydiota bacterium]